MVPGLFVVSVARRGGSYSLIRGISANGPLSAPPPTVQEQGP